MDDFKQTIINVNDLNITRKCLDDDLNVCSINTCKDFIEYQSSNSNTKNMNLGIIHFDDLLDSLFNGYVIESDDGLYKQFVMIDEDCDGYIEIEELKNKFKEYDKLNEYKIGLKLIEIHFTKAIENNKIDYQEFLNALQNERATQKQQWEIERIIWIGYEKNIDNNKCYISKLPKVLVKKCLSYLSSRF